MVATESTIALQPRPRCSSSQSSRFFSFFPSFTCGRKKALSGWKRPAAMTVTPKHACVYDFFGPRSWSTLKLCKATMKPASATTMPSTCTALCTLNQIGSRCRPKAAKTTPPGRRKPQLMSIRLPCALILACAPPPASPHTTPVRFARVWPAQPTEDDLSSVSLRSGGERPADSSMVPIAAARKPSRVVPLPSHVSHTPSMRARSITF
mmetsp:Transcript_37862/g.88600  ORF Transcript_37862/g.88600 Transcript_37862/m.88600 type:complete len:208 (+) Transcript_37862:755-1378(+)